MTTDSSGGFYATAGKDPWVIFVLGLRALSVTGGGGHKRGSMFALRDGELETAAALANSGYAGSLRPVPALMVSYATLEATLGRVTSSGLPEDAELLRSVLEWLPTTCRELPRALSPTAAMRAHLEEAHEVRREDMARTPDDMLQVVHTSKYPECAWEAPRTRLSDAERRGLMDELDQLDGQLIDARVRVDRIVARQDEVRTLLRSWKEGR